MSTNNENAVKIYSIDFNFAGILPEQNANTKDIINKLNECGIDYTQYYQVAIASNTTFYLIPYTASEDELKDLFGDQFNNIAAVTSDHPFVEGSVYSNDPHFNDHTVEFIEDILWNSAITADLDLVL